MAQCTYHPDRPGVGICMRCRAVICAACCTRLDGVNHCHACLKVLGKRETRRESASYPVGLFALAFLGLAWTVFCVLAWTVQGKLAP
jgi:hypothetical protein